MRNERGLRVWISARLLSVGTLTSAHRTRGRQTKSLRYILIAIALLPGALVGRAVGAGQPSREWAFSMCDWDKDGKPDLVCIKKRGPSGATEIRILSNGSNFREFLVDVATGLHATDGSVDNGEWEFAMCDFDKDGWPDLACIQKNDRGRTSVHGLSGASKFKHFNVHEITGLHATDGSVDNGAWDFAMCDFDGDRKPDLACIHKKDRDRTAIHGLSGASGFKHFNVHEVTGLHPTDGSVDDGAWDFAMCDFDGDRKPDLACIHVLSVLEERFEVHILSGSASYKGFIRQQAFVNQLAKERSARSFRTLLNSRTNLSAPAISVPESSFGLAAYGAVDSGVSPRQVVETCASAVMWKIGCVSSIPFSGTFGGFFVTIGACGMAAYSEFNCALDAGTYVNSLTLYDTSGAAGGSDRPRGGAGKAGGHQGAGESPGSFGGSHNADTRGNNGGGAGGSSSGGRSFGTPGPGGGPSFGISTTIR
jgi:FG-GAP-like repeat